MHTYTCDLCKTHIRNRPLVHVREGEILFFHDESCKKQYERDEYDKAVASQRDWTEEHCSPYIEVK